jgi:hypothetical protein
MQLLSNIPNISCKNKKYVITRVVDPDPDWIRIQKTLWIQIRIRIGNPDPDPGARKLRNFSGKNALFSYFCKKNLPIKRYNYSTF